jgi:hypothetical protein
MRKALFKVGDKVRYLGDRKVWDEKKNPIIFKGMEVTILTVKDPRKGYGFIKNDEDGEPLVDRDNDGYNTYNNTPNPMNARIIWPEDGKDWEKV